MYNTFKRFYILEKEILACVLDFFNTLYMWMYCNSHFLWNWLDANQKPLELTALTVITVH